METCVYCHSEHSQPVYHTSDVFGNDYLLRACDDCKAVFLTPKPDAALLAKAYDDSYYGDGNEKFKSSSIERVLDFFRKKRAKTLSNYAPSGKVLDIGCGNGRFLQFVKEQGDYEIHGIEMEGGSAHRAAKVKGLQLKIGMLQPDDYTPDSFDAITLFHVFEHLTEPKETLETIYNILKPGGIAILSFPNIDSIQSRIFKGKWLHLDPPRHLFFFRPTDFKRHLRAIGFNLISESHFHIEYNPFGMSQSMLNTVFKKRELLYEHLKGNKEYTGTSSKLSLRLQRIFYQLTLPLFISSDVIASVFRKGATVQFIFRKPL